MIRLTALFALSLVACQSPGAGTPPAPAPSAADRFQRLADLAGTWVALDGSTMAGAEVHTAVTAGGSAVEEHLFPGTDHEMVTVYYVDGEDLFLHHYCMLGNQPTMRALPGGASDRLRFELVSATGLEHPGEQHMHSAEIEFLGPDRLRTVWTPYRDGEALEPVRLELQRKGG